MEVSARMFFLLFCIILNLFLIEYTYGEPVANCLSLRSLKSYYFIVDSTNRCIYYPCHGWDNRFEAPQRCPQGQQTSLSYPTNNFPCVWVGVWACTNAPAPSFTVKYTGFDLDAVLNPPGPCNPSPCVNGGTCDVVTYDSTYYALNSTDDSFTNSTLITNSTVTDSPVTDSPVTIATVNNSTVDNSTVNNSTVNNATDFTCTCPADYQGDLCEISPCFTLSTPSPYTSEAKTLVVTQKVEGMDNLTLEVTPDNKCSSSNILLFWTISPKDSTSSLWGAEAFVAQGLYSDTTNVTFSVPKLLSMTPTKYHVHIKALGWETAKVDIYFKLVMPKLTASIAGHIVQFTTIGSPIIIDARGSTDDYDPRDITGPLQYSWSCAFGNKYTPEPRADLHPDKCHPELLWIYNSTESNLTVPTDLLRKGSYTFRLKVSKNGREDYRDVLIGVRPSLIETPKMDIECHSNCLGEKRPLTQRLTLVLICDICYTCPVPAYKWTGMTRSTASASPEWHNIAVPDITTTGDNNLGFSVEALILNGSSSYKIQANFSCPALFPDATVAIYEFDTEGTVEVTQVPEVTDVTTVAPEIPRGGECKILPKQGKPDMTKFIIMCRNWKSNAGPLSYSMAKQDGTVFYTGKKVSSTFTLPKGRAADEYNQNVTITITGRDEGTTSVIVRAVVGKPVEEADLDDAGLDSVVAAVEETVGELDIVTDRRQAAQTLTSLAEMLNDQTPTTEDSPTDLAAGTVTQSKVSSGRSKVRETMVTQIQQITSSVNTVDEIVLVSKALESTTETNGEVNENTMVTAASALDTLATIAKSLLVQSPAQTIPVTKSILTAVWNVQSCTKPRTEIPAEVVKDTPVPLDPEELRKFEEEEEQNPLSPAERAYTKRKLDIAIKRERMKSRKTAESLFLTSTTMTDKVFSVVATGDDPVVVTSSKAVMSIQKLSSHALTNVSFESDYGEVQLPDLSSGNESVNVETKASTFKSNPYLWGDNSASITSPVTTLDVRAENGSFLLINDQVSVSLKATTKIKPTEVKLNSSLNAQTGMVYHKVNVTVQGSVIALDLNPPRSADAIEVYLNDIVQPTSVRYLHRIELNLTDRPLENATVPVTFAPAYVKTTGIYFIGVKPIILEKNYKGSRTKRSLSPTDTSDTYSVAIGTTACRVWDSDLNDWVVGGEIDASKSTLQSTTCKVKVSATKSSFGLSFIAPPNMIDFSTVWAKFADLKNNAAVFSVVIVIIGLYIVGLVFAIREDRKDKLKWAAQMLDDNLCIHAYEYLITVETGLKAGAGTRSNVWFILYGSAGNTGLRNLEGKLRMDFPMGSVRTFIMRTNESLGQIYRLQLWHDNTGRGSAASWYVENFTVIDVPNRDVFTFLCRSWLSLDREESVAEGIFQPANRTETSKFSYLYSRSRFFTLTDTHLWLSVLLRPTRSTFTRAQRLSCCIATLFLAMVTSAMFYGTEENVERPAIIRLGPFILSFQEIWVSFISIVITVPPMILVIEIFRKAKERKKSTTPKHVVGKPLRSFFGTKKHDIPYTNGISCDHFDPVIDLSLSPSGLELDFGEFVDKKEASSEVSDKKLDRTKLVKEVLIRAGQLEDDRVKQFPWWTLVIGWTVCLLAILVPAFFVILYSMDWGPTVANAWLTSHILAIFESIFLCDPSKVIIVALIGAVLIWRHKLKEAEKLQDEGESYEDCHDYLRKMYGGNGDPEEKKKRRERETVAMGRLKELLLHTFYLLLVIMVGIGAVDPNSYGVKETVYNTYIPCFRGKVSSKAGFFTYLEDCFIPSYFSVTDMNGQTLPWRLRGFTTDFTAYRVGPARLRQLRVKSDGCRSRGYFTSHQCFSEYSTTVEDRASYIPEVIHNDTSRETYETHDAWHYTSSETIRGEPVWAQEGYYEGGGYVANFDINRNISLKIIKELKEHLWLDRQTRGLMIEFTTFNPNVNLFAYVTMVAEFPPTGGVIQFTSIEIIQSYALGFFITIVYLCGIVAIVMTIAYAVIEIKDIYRIGTNYCSSAKNWLSWVVIITALASVVTFAMSLSEKNAVMAEMKLDHTAFVPFRRVVLYDESYKAAIAFLNAFCFLKLILLTRIHHRVANLLESLAVAMPALCSFLVCFITILFSFSLLGYLLFVKDMNEYKSLLSALYTLTNAALGSFDVGLMMDSVGKVATQMFFSVYILCMMMVLVNLLVSIICDGQVTVQENPITETDIDIILQKLWPHRFGNEDEKKNSDFL